MQCLFEEVNQFYLSLKSYQDTKIVKCFGHSVHCGINPPPQTPPSRSCQAPLNLQTVQAPLFSAIPPSILAFHEPP